MMSKKEAWLYLEKRCIESAPGTIIYVYPDISFWCYGLCTCISSLFGRGQIDINVMSPMLKEIKEFAPPEDIQGYRWPIGDLKSRAEFCRKMSERD